MIFKNIIESFWESFVVIKRDKVILFYAMIPIFIGVIFYVLLWSWPFYSTLERSWAWVGQQSYLENWPGLIYYVVMGIGIMIFWVFLSLTFFLVVSLVSGPFNDIISGRVEKIIKNESSASVKDSFFQVLGRLKRIIFNEIKKFICIVFISLIIIVGSWIPLFFPFSIALSSLLVAASFLDYNWVRCDMPLKKCFEDIKCSIIPYGLSGGIFLFLISLPFINVIVFPFGVVYYTILFFKQNALRIS